MGLQIEKFYYLCNQKKTKQYNTMSEIIPHRIRMARQAQGLSMDELVKRMNGAISKMSISKIERGMFRPSQDTLTAIAQVCKVPMAYFYRQDYGMKPFDFRIKGATTRQTKQAESRMIAAIENYLEQEDALRISRTQFRNPLADEPVSSYADAEAAAEKLRKEWNIGTQPIHSVYELLQEHGVAIIEMPIDCEGLTGTSTMVNDEFPVVIVNTNENTNERKRFTALHELAHLTLRFKLTGRERAESIEHPYGSLSIKAPDEERLCERFASAMLMPRESMMRRLGTCRKDITLKELISIRNMYGISISGQVHRAHDLAIISDSAYNNWYTNKINKNHMEEGWGCYPINEVADRHQLLMERMKTEYT